MGESISEAVACRYPDMLGARSPSLIVSAIATATSTAVDAAMPTISVSGDVTTVPVKPIASASRRSSSNGSPVNAAPVVSTVSPSAMMKNRRKRSTRCSLETSA